jgi:hypothetical protein
MINMAVLVFDLKIYCLQSVCLDLCQEKEKILKKEENNEKYS